MEITKTVLHINEQSFDKVLKNDLVLVDFWAEWCAPCRMQGPILDEVAKEINGKALISKLNVDDNRAIASKYGIMSIPTLLLFKKGKVVKQFVGVQPKDTLVKIINSNIE